MSVEVRTISAVPIPTAGMAAVSAVCLVLAAPPPDRVGTTYSAPAVAPPAIVLTALPSPLDLINQQVVFNVGLFADWITTGAALFQRQTQVPGSFVAAIGSGTPPLTAAAQALTAFADIEFEAGRDLIGFAQEIANFQLQFRSTTLSAFPPFNAGPGQQFVVATTTFGLNLVQGMADVANALVMAVQQFIHGLLQTPLPVAPLKASAVTATAIPVMTPRTLSGPQQSTVNTLSSTVTNVGKPVGPHPLSAMTNTVTDAPKGRGLQTLSLETHEPNGNGQHGNTHQSQDKSTHRH